MTALPDAPVVFLVFAQSLRWWSSTPELLPAPKDHQRISRLTGDPCRCLTFAFPINPEEFVLAQVYGLSESAQEHVSKASRIAKDIVLPSADDVDVNGRFPTQSMEALAAAGFYGLCLPRDVGGQGEGMRAFAGVVEELAGACGSTAMIYVMHVSAAQAIARGNERYRELLATMHLSRIRRLGRAGFTPEQAELISELHTPNFM